MQAPFRDVKPLVGLRLSTRTTEAAILLLTVILAAGCSSATPVASDSTSEPGATPPASTAAPVDTAAVDAARNLIEAADLSNTDTIDGVDGIRFTRAGAEAAAAVLAGGAGGDARWAATWVYATAGGDPAPLLLVLSDDDASVRALAGAAVLARGRIDGARVLAALVADTRQLRGSQPPLLIGDYAAAMLGRLIGGTSISGATPDALAAAWAAWLGEHETTLQFDAASHQWASE